MARDMFDGRLVPLGENPNGVTFVTPNGVAHDQGDGANHQMGYEPSINGPRWRMPEPGGTIVGPDINGGFTVGGTTRQTAGTRRNRTGE
jgi:hypothetical protein